MQRIYFDCNATTPLDPLVTASLNDTLSNHFGNPSSIHWHGQQARGRIEDARRQVATLVGASPTEIVFTSCGTEADNAALRGVAAAAPADRRKILVSSIEHHAVLNVAQALAREGWQLGVIHAGSAGRIDLDDLRAQLDAQTALVAVLLANNETGVLQPVAAAARLAHAHGALFHCDAIQAAGRLPLDVNELGADLVALSAHKFHGPKGVGALYVRRGTRLEPFLRGGGQEKNRRAGTENVPGIVAAGVAADLARQLLGTEPPRLTALRDRLDERLLALPGAHRNGCADRLCNTTSLSFEGIEAESLVMALDLAGLSVSTGAACSAGTVEPSHVLRAMGLSPERVRSSIRVSLGRFSTEEEVDRAAELIGAAVHKRRGVTRRPK
jgi:cysteine desulfurase